MMTMFISLGPTMAVRKIAKVSAGSASQVSVMRIMTWSTQPPRYPEMMPSPVPIAPATATAVKPTTIDTLAPKMSRDSTSRPRWSVPRRYAMSPPCCQAGGRKRAARLPISGSCGATQSANIANSAMPPRINVGSTGKPSSRRGAKREETSAASVCTLMPLTLKPNARIDHGVEDVDQQVDDDDHGAAQQNDRLHHREIAGGDALVE